MKRELANIHVVAGSKPPGEALEIIKLWREEAASDVADAHAIISTETAFLRMADAVVSNLEAIVNGTPLGLDLADPDDGADEAIGRSKPIFEALPSPTFQIIESLRNGPKTLRQIEDDLAGAVSYHTIYAIVLHGAENLVDQGIVKFDKSRRPGIATLIKTDGLDDLAYDDFVQKICAIDKTVTENDPVVRRMAKAIKVFTIKVIRPRNDGKRLHAYRTWGAIENRGLIGAMEVMVTGTLTDGFTELPKLGYADLLAEQIVVDHADRFSQKAVASAKRRLETKLPDVA